MRQSVVEEAGGTDPCQAMGFGASPFTPGGSSSACWKNHSITPKPPSTAPTPSTSTPCLRNPSGPRYDLPAALLQLLTNPPQRQAFVRVARQQTASVARRTFITPTAVRSGEASQLRALRQY